ncbi:MAG: energy-coupling factor transporter transmembrane protein EcfT [Clostridia bacterium]|nr:energy-coupling factor transporter transmembrane protein EcfT [Clostridia bacterium]
MRNKDAFSSCHPLVNFLFFGLTIGFSSFVMHPVSLLISLICAAVYNIYLNGRRGAYLSVFFMLPVLLLTALVNPAFNHRGQTVITYLPGGNPLTLESVIYGVAAGVLLACVICWFACFNAVMTSDKFLYLFGRILPSLSLLISMTLRFIPRFRVQLRQVKDARSFIDGGRKGLFGKIRRAATVVSVMITWALENGIHTADSMKGRGYGLPHRTSFSVYRFERRDAFALLWLLCCGAYLIAGALRGGFYFGYYPRVSSFSPDPYFISVQAVYLALCATPLTLDHSEDLKWKKLRSAL